MLSASFLRALREIPFLGRLIGMVFVVCLAHTPTSPLTLVGAPTGLHEGLHLLSEGWAKVQDLGHTPHPSTEVKSGSMSLPAQVENPPFQHPQLIPSLPITYSICRNDFFLARPRGSGGLPPVAEERPRLPLPPGLSHPTSTSMQTGCLLG